MALGPRPNKIQKITNVQGFHNKLFARKTLAKSDPRALVASVKKLSLSIEGKTLFDSTSYLGLAVVRMKACIFFSKHFK